MFGSIMAALLLVTMCITKDPTYAVAAGLFELAGVLYGITRPKRFTIKEVKQDGDTDRSSRS